MAELTQEQKRIAELEEQLAEVQSTEGSGKNPELEAKARQMARMSWMDVAFCLEELGMGDLGAKDVEQLQTALIDRKYDYLAGNNKTALSWQA